jgi:acetolactate synthase-1/3 small subunit
MFSRREFNIDSLAVGTTHTSELSRITVVSDGDLDLIEQITKQLKKLSDVKAVQLFNADTAVFRGLTLIKVQAAEDSKLELLKISELFRAHTIDVQPRTLTFEITGDDEKVSAFMNAVTPYGTILEIIRTGLVALERGEHTIYEHCEERKYYGKNLL